VTTKQSIEASAEHSNSSPRAATESGIKPASVELYQAADTSERSHEPKIEVEASWEKIEITFLSDEVFRFEGERASKQETTLSLAFRTEETRSQIVLGRHCDDSPNCVASFGTGRKDISLGQRWKNGYKKYERCFANIFASHLTPSHSLRAPGIGLFSRSVVVLRIALNEFSPIVEKKVAR